MKKLLILLFLSGCADFQVGTTADGIPIRRYVLYSEGETVVTAGDQPWLLAKQDIYWDYIDKNDSGSYEREFDVWRKYYEEK